MQLPYFVNKESEPLKDHCVIRVLQIFQGDFDHKPEHEHMYYKELKICLTCFDLNWDQFWVLIGSPNLSI